LDSLGLRRDLMPEIIRPGTVVGRLKDQLASELQIDPIPVIAVGSHDTACAVAGVPVSGGNWAYISSGTWSLVGLEVPQAIIDDKTYRYSFTNEGGIDHTIRLLKNVMGLWLVQECRRQWLADGDTLSYEDLTEMARQAKPFVACVDPDYHEFLSPGSMPAKINRYLEKTGQQPINDKGQMIRIILESLALKYRWIVERLEEIRGHKIDLLHVVGGGIKNELLCQLTADSTGCSVIAGPAEAAAAGNAIVQAWAAGQIPSLGRGRDIIGNSFDLKSYIPQNTKSWDRRYEILADKW
jgi:rhamnulokinase